MTVASLFVDPQKGFTPLCPNELPIPGGHEIVPALMELYALSTVRACSSDAHCAAAAFVSNAEHPAFSDIQLPNTDKAFPRHCEPGTTGFELLDGLPPVSAYDYFVWKGIHPELHPYGACFHDLNNQLSTGLNEVFHSRGVTHVLLGGLATDICVAATAFQLRSAGFAVGLYMPACRGLTPAGVAAQYTAMNDAGVALLPDLAALKAWVAQAQANSDTPSSF